MPALPGQVRPPPARLNDRLHETDVRVWNATGVLRMPPIGGVEVHAMQGSALLRSCVPAEALRYAANQLGFQYIF